MIRRSERKASGKRFPFLVFLITICGLGIGFYYFIGTHYLPVQRTTVLFLTDPVEVASYEPSQQKWTRVQFPTSTHIAGIQGLGQYAVDSLWNIAATEGSPSAVVLGSLTDELGVPIEYYAGENGKMWTKLSDQENITSIYFSFSGAIQRIFNKLHTNIPIPLYIALMRSFRSTPAHTIATAFLEKGSGLSEKKLPDNSTILEFERDQFDSLTDNFFEDKQIRDEHLRIIVLNTTGRPFLGSRAARIIDRLGANIIQIGNENQVVDSCEISGTTEQLKSKTSQSISQLFGCEKKTLTEEGRADLTVRIGKKYEQRFLPKNK